MTTFVLPADAVHESAALCDYLVDRLDSDDIVHAVTSTPDESTPQARRDSEDAQNAIYARLGAIATVDRHTESVNSFVEALLAVADRTGADEIVISHTPEQADETARLLAQSSRPVVVVPFSE